MYTINDVKKKDGKYHCAGEVFVIDNCGSIFREIENVRLFFCKTNGRNIKDAIVDCLNLYMI